MTQTPPCPKCGTEVQPSWDWCHACGYDPAGLKPAEPRAAAPAPAPAPRPAARPAVAPPVGEATARSTSPGATTWVAPAPTAAGGGNRVGAVTTVVDIGAARPQAMRDPDWVQQEPRRGLSVAALVGLVAVVAAAVVALVVVTLIVLHRPIGTANDGAQPLGPGLESALTTS